MSATPQPWRRIPALECPHCARNLSAALSREHRAPELGDYIVCAHCLLFSEVAAGGVLEARRWDECPDDVLPELLDVRAEMAMRLRLSN